MNTPGHLIVGAAAFARPGAAAVTLAAFLGALAPDLSVIVMVWWAENVQGHSPGHIFNTLYFSDSWQRIFAIDNSIPLWGALALVAAMTRFLPLLAFAGAGLLHLFADLALHHDDGRAHFWPFTAWKYESPVSYWDSGHNGHVAAAVLFVLCCVLVGLLLRRFQGAVMRLVFVALLAGEGFFAYIWITQF